LSICWAKNCITSILLDFMVMEIRDCWQFLGNYENPVNDMLR
jgi:hypothetical protein